MVQGNPSALDICVSEKRSKELTWVLKQLFEVKSLDCRNRSSFLFGGTVPSSLA